MAYEGGGPPVPPKGAADDRLNHDLLGGDLMGHDQGEAASLADANDYSNRRVLR